MAKRKNFFFIEKNGEEYTVSMTPELQDDVGTVGFIDFLDVDEVAEGEAFMNMEAAKTVFEAQAPLAGKISARNDEAGDNPELLNSEKTEENWLIKLTDVDEEAYNALEEA